MLQAVQFDLEVTDQVFSYWMGDKLLHINASLLHRVRKVVPHHFKLIEIPLDERIYDLCMNHRGIEEPKVAALRGKNLREPGYAIIWDLHLPVPSYAVVDGHHRLVRRYRGGVRVMSFWTCAEPIWRQVLMPSTPEEDAFIATQVPNRVDAPTNIVHYAYHKSSN